MPLVGEARTPALVPDDLIRRCSDEHEAILLCAHLSRLSNEHICQALAIDKGHWSRIMQGRAHFPTRKRMDFMRLCGNLAPVQYEALQSGLVIHADPLAQEEADLTARLEQIRSQRAA